MGDGEAAGRSLLDAALLRDVLRQLEGTDVDEFEIRSGSSRLVVRRDPGVRSRGAEGERTAPAVDGTPVVAPLTGVYYSRPSPDALPFVSPGQPVAVGDVVALIETMKLFNEVTAEFAGEVMSIVPAEGDLVEVGQPILYIRPRVDGGEL